MEYRPVAMEQIDKIRERMQRDGQTIVLCDELSILCPGVDPARRLKQVSNVAQWEGWKFELLPYGNVKFYGADTPSELADEATRGLKS